MDDQTNEATPGHARKGFASLTPERRREIAAKGGRSVKPENRTFTKNPDIAKLAGAKGGRGRVQPETVDE